MYLPNEFLFNFFPCPARDYKSMPGIAPDKAHSPRPGPPPAPRFPAQW